MKPNRKLLLKRYHWLLNFYGPFFGAGIKIKEVNQTGNRFLVEMKTRWYNKNLYGTHFGGSLYAMSDPFYVFAAYSHFGDDYIIWDKSAHIEFVKPGKGTVYGLFEIPKSQLVEMKNHVDEYGKGTFEFQTHIKQKKDDQIVAVIIKEIYIRKKNPLS